MLMRAKVAAFVFFVAAPLFAQLAVHNPVPVLKIQNVGSGVVELGGPWQFHLGDNPAFASPTLDDATGHNGWEQLTADAPWGAQGHRSYVGYAWYRKHLSIAPASGASPDWRLLISHIGDV